ncbi:MAG: ModE family transcriptional regulator, partial [Burkholderiaceae bacterium]|nr:ModE family transcriptional regulator [Burkholderiaceae bacterium]
LLSGRANRISRGDTGDEIALEIGHGLQLVGFAPSGSGLRVGTRVLARVEESAVVVALAG